MKNSIENFTGTVSLSFVESIVYNTGKSGDTSLVNSHNNPALLANDSNVPAEIWLCYIWFIRIAVFGLTARFRAPDGYFQIFVKA